MVLTRSRIQSLANHHFVTYNILSHKLCSPKSFPKNHPKACEPRLRFDAITSKLKEQVERKANIALQEVPRGWEGKLQVFFSQNNYTFITSLYGNEKNDYMGVGIAISNDSYTIEDCDIVRVSDTHPFKLPKKYEEGWMEWGLKTLKKRLGYKIPRRKEVDSAAARWRFNTMIFTRLNHIETNDTICLATYHMPCAYFRPAIMVIHTALCAQWAQKQAAGDALVIAGDFNFGPDSDTYRLMTTGALDEDSPNRPDLLKGDTLEIDLKYPLSSAYAEHDEEPAFTNHALIMLPWEKDDREPFTSCLDFVFYDKSMLKVVDTIPTPATTEELGGLLPTLDEPSDHLMIGATFNVKQ